MAFSRTKVNAGWIHSDLLAFIVSFFLKCSLGEDVSSFGAMLLFQTVFMFYCWSLVDLSRTRRPQTTKTENSENVPLSTFFKLRKYGMVRTEHCRVAGTNKKRFPFSSPLFIRKLRRRQTTDDIPDLLTFISLYNKEERERE